jgi:lauroyl/myristoyl acyltransferase
MQQVKPMLDKTTFIRLALAMAAPIKRITARTQWLEERLELPLSDADHVQIAKALERDTRELGDYYHWYLEKALVARELKNATREGVLAIATAADRTDYTQLDHLFQDTAGLVLAIPHFGNYILAIVSLFERYGRDREIGVFYAPSESNKGNEVFDFIYELCFRSNPASRTRILHANRAGLVDAMKLLRAGGALLMLPDVSLNTADAYVVPFLGRTFDAMLGSASLARRTNSRLVPVMPIQTGNLAFQIQHADPIRPTGPAAAAVSPYADLAADYAATVRMFATFEKWMAGHTYMWQPIREHFVKSAPYQELDPQGLEKLWPTFLMDPRVQASDQANVIELRAPHTTESTASTLP